MPLQRAQTGWKHNSGMGEWESDNTGKKAKRNAWPVLGNPQSTLEIPAWIEQVPHPPVPQALVVLLRSLQGVPESAPSLPRVLCQVVLSFPKLVLQLESAFPGRCALLGDDGRSRAIGIQDSPCPPGIHQSWAVYPCLAGDLCAQMVVYKPTPSSGWLC